MVNYNGDMFATDNDGKLYKIQNPCVTSFDMKEQEEIKFNAAPVDDNLSLSDDILRLMEDGKGHI